MMPVLFYCLSFSIFYFYRPVEHDAQPLARAAAVRGGPFGGRHFVATEFRAGWPRVT